MTGKRSIVVTPALPYANGPIHIGHLVEYSLPDFWVRFQRMRGHTVHFVCAADTHGTPIMMNAKKQGITPESLVERFRTEHMETFKKFEISFDHYGSTNSPTNKKISDRIFKALDNKKLLETKTQMQAYCETDGMFLPDRYIKGTCPKCGSVDQYGDGCEVCGTVYSAADLKNPHCSICGRTPIEKASEHLFVKLEDFRPYLKEWVPEHTSPEVAKKLAEWFDGELQSWCISRDDPYFGFEIPGHPHKYYYVWFDAPIGYLAALEESLKGGDFDTLWNDPKTEIYHSIGKDIVYHHALFWPSMLKSADLATPTGIWVHGMLQVNGAKMSKSRGTSVFATTFQKHLDPVYLRYYLACKMSSSIDDIDLNFDDFVSRVNSDLIGKITNVASRGAQMLQKLGGAMGELSSEAKELVIKAQDLGDEIAQCYEEREFAKAMILIRSIADDANKYFDKYEPWKLVKTDEAATRQILTGILNQFRIMAIYLKPVMPSYAAKVEALFQEPGYLWESSKMIIENHTLAPFEHLLKRVEPAQVEKILEETKKIHAANAPAVDPLKALALQPTISIDDFQKIDLRVARIAAAQHVEGAGKLLQLTLDLGNGVTRNVFSGIKSAYKPEDLVGKMTVMVANLAPRKMKFGVSEGMVLASGDGENIALLFPDTKAEPGQRIN
ncbi:MAG: methionine--tRNA ligase [Chitinophagaceae bacterium]|nr:methionine--tRNA ligase [Oligoflexus sp.]